MRKAPHVAGVPSGEESRTSENGSSELRKATDMFPYSDPQTQLDLHRRRVDELIRQAADRRRVRIATGGRHRRFGRLRDTDDGRRATQVTATA